MTQHLSYAAVSSFSIDIDLKWRPIKRVSYVDCNLACEPKAKHGKGSSGGGGRKRKADGDGNEGEYDYASDYW